MKDLNLINKLPLFTFLLLDIVCVHQYIHNLVNSKSLAVMFIVFFVVNLKFFTTNKYARDSDGELIESYNDGYMRHFKLESMNEAEIREHQYLILGAMIIFTAVLMRLLYSN